MIREDTVSRQAVMKAIEEVGLLTCEYIDVKQAIKSLPFVQPIRPKGKWIDCAERDPWYRCSECKERVWGGHRNFCPNCGADMRGDTE